MMVLPEVTLYTDGACSPNPGTGGWGVVVLSGGRVQKEMSGREEQTTNNRMELTAALRGLEYLKAPQQVTVITDSTYVKNGITSWIHGWKKRGWRTATKEPVKNRDLWEALEQEITRHRVTWKWVKGHSQNKWNERVDTLAVSARSRADSAVADTVQRNPPALPDNEGVRIFSGVTYAPSRGCGSWAVLLSYQHHLKVLGGSARGESANQFHLLSALAGLAALKRPLPVTLYTTSGYIRDGVSSWLESWQRRGWRTSEGKAVSHEDLWRQLARYLQTYRLTVEVVERKDGFCLMQEAKELAREW